MASNKNQHFVPKAYLRPFCLNGQRSINVYIIGREKAVEKASIKDQCSRHYFYGTVEVFEDFLQFFEGRYGAVVSRLRTGEIPASDISTLFDFFVLQHLRTPQKLEQRLEMLDAFRNIIIGGKALHEVSPEARHPTDLQREMQEQIYMSAKMNEFLHDLEPVFLLNRTSTPFITSDNPACMTNRLYSQRYRDETSGLAQSGVAIAMPISDRIAFFAYDRDVYQPIGNDHCLEVRNAKDVDRINELQALAATKTLFFSNWEDREYVSRLAKRCVPARRDCWSFTWTGIYVGEDEEFEEYRKVTEDDAESTATRITSVSMYTPRPTTWPSFLQFRLRPKGFMNNFVVGFVRPAHALRESNRRLRPTILPLALPRESCVQQRQTMFVRKK